MPPPAATTLATTPPTTRHSVPVVRVRLALLGLLGMLTVAWLVSLVAPLHPAALADSPAVPADQPLIAQVLTPPTWRDTLVVQVALATPGVYQQRAALRWTVDGRERVGLPFTLRADGHPQRLVLPVGAHPQWQGTITDVRLVIPQRDPALVQIDGVALVPRSVGALDALLLHRVAPLLPALPPWPHALLLVAALLGGAGALLGPWGPWRHRLALLAIALGTLVAGVVLVVQLQLLTLVAPRYAALTTTEAQLATAPYELPPAALDQLGVARDQVPAGPVLLLDIAPVSDLLHRARYLLYPRPVDQRSPQTAPTDLPALLATEYHSVIERNPTGTPPAPGWVRRATGPGPLAVWVNPAAPPAAPPPTVSWRAWPLLLGGIALVGAFGWGVAGWIGWRGAVRGLSAWPLGVFGLAVWLWLLAVVGVAWGWASVGLPLGVLSGALWWHTRQRPALPPPYPPQPWARWEWAGVGLLVVLGGAVTATALLLPFTDRDSWTLWGLKGQAFFHDGDLARVLTLYQAFDAHHASYPPALPLVQTWLYAAMGGRNERLVKLIFPLWYLVCVGLVWLAGRWWATRRAALGWALLVATTPLVLDHATLNNADLPLAVGWLLGALSLAVWLDTGARPWLVGGVLALGSAAWLKLDGTYVGLALLGSAVALRVLTARRKRAQVQALQQGALALGSFVAVLVPWWWYTGVLQLDSAVPRLDGGQQAWGAALWAGTQVLGSAVLFSDNNSSLGLLGGGYGLLWLFCTGAVVCGWRRLRHNVVLWWLVLVVAGGVAFYLSIYLLRPYYSVERYLLHLAPIAVLAAIRATGTRVPRNSMRPRRTSSAMRWPDGCCAAARISVRCNGCWGIPD